MVKADPKRNYYADLEISPTANTEDIKKQFRKLARIYHPDRNPGKEVEFVPKFQAIQAAHEILSDPEQRAKYDADRRRLGYGPRTSPQQARPTYNQWQSYGNVPRTGGGPPYAPGASAYNNAYRNAYDAGMPQTPPRPHPTSNTRERMRTSSGFTRSAGQGTGAGAWTDTRPPASGYRYSKPPQSSKADEDMYYNAFNSFNPRGASQAHARKSSNASGTETPSRGRKKAGFDPNIPGDDEPSAKTAGYNTRPRAEASGPPSEEEMAANQGPRRPSQPLNGSSDEMAEAQRRPRAKKAERAERAAARKKAAELAAEKKAAELRNQASAAGTAGLAGGRSGSEADSSGSNPNSGKPSTSGERVKAVPSRKWKNFQRSDGSVDDLDTAGVDSMYATISFSFPTLQPRPSQGVMEEASSIPPAEAPDTLMGDGVFNKPHKKTFRSQTPQEARLFGKINICARRWAYPSQPQEQPSHRVADGYAYPTSRTEPLGHDPFIRVSEADVPSNMDSSSSVPEYHPSSSVSTDNAFCKMPWAFTSTPHFKIFESKSGVLFEEITHMNKDDSTPKAKFSQFPNKDFSSRKKREASSDLTAPGKRPGFRSSNVMQPLAEADLIAQMHALPNDISEAFTMSKNYYTNKSRLQRNATPNVSTSKSPPINTAFSADWSDKPFTFKSATSSQVSDGGAQPFPGPNLFASTSTEPQPTTTAEEPSKTAPGPTVEEVSESPEKSQPEVQNLSTQESQPADKAAGEKPAPVKFSVEHWEETFKKPVFTIPKVPITVPPQAAPGVKSSSSSRRPSQQRIRSPSKAGDKPAGDSVPSGTASRPIIVEEENLNADADVDAMDIDTPPNSTEQARAPRLVRVPASRSDWREPTSTTATSSTTPQGDVNAAPPASSRQSTPASERRRKSSARDIKTTSAVTPTALNMSSLKSQLSPQGSGVGDLDELHVNLPFESRASAQHPASTKYEDITTVISHPKPPHPPVLPTSGSITEKHYRNLLAAMSSYMGAFHKYESEILSQFSLRCKEGGRFGTGIPSTDATALLNAKGEPRGKGVLAYAEALREEKSTREEWVKATDEYMRAVTGWAILKGMVLDRGFAK